MSRALRDAFAPALCAIAVLSLQVTASVAHAASDPQAELLKVLSSRYPDTKFEAARPSATLLGWYEVETNAQLIYSDASGDHLIVGYVVDTKTHEDLTAKRWRELIAVDVAKLPLTQAIKIVQGNGSRVLVTFEDPLCPYCEKLEQELAQVTDLTRYVFLFPLEKLHPGATEKSQQIWCSTDPAAAWTQWMLKRTAPSAATCPNNPITANLALADQLRVQATPTLIFQDGSRIASALTKEQLEQQLARGSSAKPESPPVAATR